MTVKRRRYGLRGHGYAIDGEKVPGVTTVLKCLPMDALVGWAAKVTAEYALDYWSELEQLRPSEKLSRLLGARNQIRDAAAKRGTEVHRLASSLVEGESVAVPEELAGHVDAYRRWLDLVEPVPLATELVVASRTHRYCGTADLVADLPTLEHDGELIPAARWLLELKTTATGVWPESALQSTAYSRAEVYVHPEEPDVEQPMELLGIERCGVVWIKSDTAELRPVSTSAELWDFFLHLRWLFDHMELRQSKPVLPMAWIGTVAAPAELVPT